MGGWKSIDDLLAPAVCHSRWGTEITTLSSQSSCFDWILRYYVSLSYCCSLTQSVFWKWKCLGERRDIKPVKTCCSSLNFSSVTGGAWKISSSGERANLGWSWENTIKWRWWRFCMSSQHCLACMWDCKARHNLLEWLLRKSWLDFSIGTCVAGTKQQGLCLVVTNKK